MNLDQSVPGLFINAFLEGDEGKEPSMHCDGTRFSSCCVTWAPSPQGKYEDAEPLYRRAMEITEGTLGKNHPQYSTTLSNLAKLLEKQVNINQCLCIFGEALLGWMSFNRMIAFGLPCKQSPAQGFSFPLQSRYVS